MILNQKEIELFKSLGQSSIGKDIAEFAERLVTSMCDSRNWGPNDTKDVVNKAADLVQKELIDRIRLQNTKKVNKQEFNECE